MHDAIHKHETVLTTITLSQATQDELIENTKTKLREATAALEKAFNDKSSLEYQTLLTGYDHLGLSYDLLQKLSIKFTVQTKADWEEFKKLSETEMRLFLEADPALKSSIIIHLQRHPDELAMLFGTSDLSPAQLETFLLIMGNDLFKNNMIHAEVFKEYFSLLVDPCHQKLFIQAAISTMFWEVLTLSEDNPAVWESVKNYLQDHLPEIIKDNVSALRVLLEHKPCIDDKKWILQLAIRETPIALLTISVSPTVENDSFVWNEIKDHLSAIVRNALQKPNNTLTLKDFLEICKQKPEYKKLLIQAALPLFPKEEVMKCFDDLEVLEIAKDFYDDQTIKDYFIGNIQHGDQLVDLFNKPLPGEHKQIIWQAVEPHLVKIVQNSGQLNALFQMITPTQQEELLNATAKNKDLQKTVEELRNPASITRARR